MAEFDFFHFSKLFWMIARPGNLLVLILALGLCFKYLTKGRLGLIGRYLIMFTTITLLVLTVFPVGSWVLGGWETQYRTPQVGDYENVDGIIALGGALNPYLTETNNSYSLNDNVERVTTFITLMKQYPDATAVYSGGNGSVENQNLKEADYIYRLLRDFGVDTSNVVFEKNSRNTYENAMLSKEQVKPTDDQTWFLVTSGYHMPRAKLVFDKAGWTVVPYPVDLHTTEASRNSSLCLCFSSNISQLETVVHEWLGILAYRLSGRI